MPIFRAMPNIPVVVEEGATAVAANEVATAEDKAVVERIFRAVGVVCFVDEDAMDAVTALSGSGPALHLHGDRGDDCRWAEDGAATWGGDEAG